MSVSPFSAAHRRYVKSLYKRMLENERNWVVRYDLWRARACVVRAEFERNRWVFPPISYLYMYVVQRLCRNVHDPRALAVILQKAEEDLARNRHPDPYIRALSPNAFHSPSLTMKPVFVTAAAFPGGTKWYVVLYLPCGGFLTPLRSCICSGAVGDSQGTQLTRMYSTPPPIVRSCSPNIHPADTWSHLRPRSTPLICRANPNVLSYPIGGYHISGHYSVVARGE